MKIVHTTCPAKRSLIFAKKLSLPTFNSLCFQKVVGIQDPTKKVPAEEALYLTTVFAVMKMHGRVVMSHEEKRHGLQKFVGVVSREVVQSVWGWIEPWSQSPKACKAMLESLFHTLLITRHVPAAVVVGVRGIHSTSRSGRA